MGIRSMGDCKMHKVKWLRKKERKKEEKDVPTSYWILAALSRSRETSWRKTVYHTR